MVTVGKRVNDKGKYAWKGTMDQVSVCHSSDIKNICSILYTLIVENIKYCSKLVCYLRVLILIQWVGKSGTIEMFNRAHRGVFLRLVDSDCGVICFNWFPLSSLTRWRGAVNTHLSKGIPAKAKMEHMEEGMV